jgi:hypothetical protein
MRRLGGYLRRFGVGTVAALGMMALVMLAAGSALRGVRAGSGGSFAAGMDSAANPVFVELFTSEGCSTCPPADDLLAQIEQKIPNSVVLSEHVTYWNDGGWHDPFSLDESTERQSDYVAHMGLDSSYTPQMVVDGTQQFTGTDAQAATQAIARALNEARVPVHIADVKAGDGGRVSFAVEAGAVKSTSQLLVVVAQDEGTRHVSSGENGGHTLRHVMIARSFLTAAKIKSGASYSGQLTVKLPEAVSGSGWHLVAFLQQGRGGPVLGVASVAVQSGSSAAAAGGE